MKSQHPRDGVAPPAPRPFLTAEWRYLVMINFEIDPAILTPLVPQGAELDSWEGRTLISVVGFRFLNARVRGWSIPWHRDFDEVNLRFYVRRQVGGEIRRAVAFVREVVPKWAIAWVARVAYNEPYVSLPMRHRVHMERARNGQPGSARYEWKLGRWYAIEAMTAGPPQPLIAGSEAEFIAEHYWGYTAQRDGSTLEYRVTHPPWRVWQTVDSHFDCDVERMYGPQFCGALTARPCSALVAEGSAVAVYPGVRI